MNSAKMDEYCAPIIALLNDADLSAKAYKDLLKATAPEIDADVNPDALKTQQTRDKLLATVQGGV